MYEVDKEVMGDIFNIEEFLLSIKDNIKVLKELNGLNNILVLSEGNPYITYKVIVSAILYNIKNVIVFTNNNYLGISHYLIKNFESLKSNISIILDISNNYNNYLSHIDKFDEVIFIGDENSYRELKEDFNNNILFIED